MRAGAHRNRAPEGTQRGGRKPPKDQEGAGAGTGAQTKRTPRQAPGPTPRKGIRGRRDQRRPTPSRHRTTPGGAEPPTRAAEARIGRRTDHTSARPPATGNHTGENGLHPQRKPTGTPPRSPPPRPHRQGTTPANTRATSGAPEEDKGTATAPRARDRDPQRTRHNGTGPHGGQPHGHLPDPPARAARRVKRYRVPHPCPLPSQWRSVLQDLSLAASQPMTSRFLWNSCKIPQKSSFFVIFGLAPTFFACASQPQIEALFLDLRTFSSILLFICRFQNYRNEP